ncbi:MAG TPA: hypothetical protein VMW81_08740 [Nitrospinota bacterium]|jgi:hypothetical protein|nr:hypothetical protein [Nitrospinota bacterium]
MVDIVIPSIINTTPVPARKNFSNNPESLRGKILDVRDGRKRQRRFKNIPFNKIIKERRCKEEPRKSSPAQDHTVSRIVTFYMESNSDLKNLIGKEIAMRVINP